LFFSPCPDPTVWRPPPPLLTRFVGLGRPFDYSQFFPPCPVPLPVGNLATTHLSLALVSSPPLRWKSPILPLPNLFSFSTFFLLCDHLQRDRVRSQPNPPSPSLRLSPPFPNIPRNVLLMRCLFSLFFERVASPKVDESFDFSANFRKIFPPNFPIYPLVLPPSRLLRLSRLSSPVR